MDFSLVDVEKVSEGIRYDYIFCLKKLFRRAHYKLSFTGDNPYVWFNDVWEALKRHMNTRGYHIEDLIEQGRPISLDNGIVEFTELSSDEVKDLTGSAARQKELLDQAVDKTMRLRQEIKKRSET